MDPSSTICALATGSVNGAVSVIRVSGPDAFAVVDSVVAFKKGTAAGVSGWKVKYGEILLPGGDLLDQVVVSLFPAPHSYTGEDCCELCCHASSFIVSAVLDRLCAAGAAIAGPGEFTQRAFVNGKMDLAQAEAVADVIAASSAAQHRLAVNQLRGGYSSELRCVRDELLKLSALLELELDFSEEEVEFADRTQLRSLALSAAGRCAALAESFKAGNALKNGIPVAIVGAPNSGKSTLLNALVGEARAIVSDIPGTTRDTVEETMVLGGYQFRFIDTAGIREASDVVEKMGIERSLEAIGKAEVVLVVVDMTASDSGIEELIGRCEGKKVIVLYNKCDIASNEGLVGAVKTGSGMRNFGKERNGLRISAKTGAGLDELRISAKTGAGLDELRWHLTAYAASLAEDNGSAVLVTNARHAAALRDAASSLQSLLAGLGAPDSTGFKTTIVGQVDGTASPLPTELLAEELRSAISSLNTILGEDLLTPQATLNSIFSRFCIGK